MQHRYIRRKLEHEVASALKGFPAVAVLGPRQCGKSTLAKKVLASFPSAVYLDLERPSDLRKLVEPELFFNLYRNPLVCLDEVQRVPEIFPVLRSIIDERKRNGQFLILGSASRDLIRQSSESLAGRIAHLELTPFLLSETDRRKTTMTNNWLRGGFPKSLLAGSHAESFRWREQFIHTFLERDIPQLGFQIPAKTLERMWMMCAHQHGQLMNQSQLGQALGVSHTTIRSYLDLLSQTFMIRMLPPYLPNLRKRLVKAPKLYIRDSGILHALLDIHDQGDLLGHPVVGASWEGLVIENVLSELTGWRGFFYRTANGSELDLILEKGRTRIAVECKTSPAPQVTQGFWNAIRDLDISEAWILAPVKEAYPISKGVVTAPPEHFIHAKK